MIYKLILNFIGLHQKTEIKEALVANSKHHRSPYISTTFMRFPWHYPLEQKVHLVLDGAAYHQSEMVRNAAKVLNIELHYLPPYSPNLNPIERLWKVMNEYVRNNIYFSSKAEFTTAINEFFNVTLPKVAGSLVSRITDNFQILKPASSS